MKELKFTPENLKRHLNAYPYSDEYAEYGRKIITARDEAKGNPGDVFLIKGVGKFVLTVCNKVTVKRNTYYFFADEEGFNSQEEFWAEIHRIYGKDVKTLYTHHLLLLNDTEAGA